MEKKFELSAEKLGAPGGPKERKEARPSRHREETRKKRRHHASAQHHRQGEVAPGVLRFDNLPSPNFSEREALQGARLLWKKLLPNEGGKGEALRVSSGEFALALDPLRYPVLPSLGGGRILVDSGGKLPPLIRSLIESEDPKLAVVTEKPFPPLPFYRALLDAAHFFSVEERFSITFGEDPSYEVAADFRVEKTSESLLRQDVTLFNVQEDHPPMPRGVVKLLAANGFRLIEPSRQGSQVPSDHLLCQVKGADPGQVTDALLHALDIPFEAQKRLPLYGDDKLGISLTVRVDRYFEANGKGYVVSFFSGDPVAYTLVRLLETKGYRVITVGKDDSLSSVAETMINALGIEGTVGRQELWPVEEAGYGMQLSGAALEDPRKRGRRIFVTDTELPPLAREVAQSRGYRVVP